LHAFYWSSVNCAIRKLSLFDKRFSFFRNFYVVFPKGERSGVSSQHHPFVFLLFLLIDSLVLLLFILAASAAMDKCDDTGCKTPANWQKPGAKLPIMGDESIMKPKAHGTCAAPLQANLLWGVDAKVADEICTRFLRFSLFLPSFLFL
jgi:hypothetical protein